jgi:hypothetical protein
MWTKFFDLISQIFRPYFFVLKNSAKITQMTESLNYFYEKDSIHFNDRLDFEIFPHFSFDFD